MPTVMLREPAILPVQGPDLLASFVEATLVVDNVIRNCESFVPTRLCGQHAPRLLLGFHVPGEQSPDLRLLTAVDDESAINDVPELRPDEQRHNDQLVRTACGISLAHRLFPDARMQDRFQVGPGLFVGEHVPAHRGPIEVAVGRQHRLAEKVADFIEGRLAGSDNLTRDQIRIDNRDAEFREHVGNR